MPAAHHLPNPFGPNSGGGTIATELAAYASRHSSPGVGGGLVQAGKQQSAHTLFEWPAACGDMGVTEEGCRKVGRKSRRGGSESRSPEVSMHSCSGADLAGLDSPHSLRHGGSSTDSLTAHYCQVCCANGAWSVHMCTTFHICPGRWVRPAVCCAMGLMLAFRVLLRVNPTQPTPTCNINAGSPVPGRLQPTPTCNINAGSPVRRSPART